jgi:hypothetical protein
MCMMIKPLIVIADKNGGAFLDKLYDEHCSMKGTIADHSRIRHDCSLLSAALKKLIPLIAYLIVRGGRVM